MPFKVVFLHPDLGIGGAERAVVDSALALKKSGYSVEFLTSHHDPSHCFPETVDGSLKVTVAGEWLPRKLFGRFHALFAYLRMIYAALYLVLFSDIKYDLIFCDQIAACIPFLKLTKCKVLFYCHFPDLLLTQRRSFWKKVYRFPIDWLEEKSTGMADLIMVNSNFTRSIFHETFKSLDTINPVILYPIPNFEALDQPVENPSAELIPEANTTFLSINRYERKKSIGLAVHALDILKRNKQGLEGIHLIIAGGYDERVLENKEHYLELKTQVEELGLANHVSFLRSISDSQKRTLLTHCTCLLYTPDKEHFGIVPVEAMYLKCPVIAVNSGGPLETVVHDQTGYLVNPDPEQFGQAMEKFLIDSQLKEKMGNAGKQWIEKKFSYDAFSQQLCTAVENILEK